MALTRTGFVTFLESIPSLKRCLRVVLRRTPSAWFLPMTSRLAIRSSVVDNMDLGADSLVDIPINEWVHLAFVFQNQTTTTSTSQRNSPITTELSSSSSSSSNSGETAGANATHEKILKRGPYVITVFVNGQLDVALTYSDNVVPNSHPLNLFKDLSHQGMTYVKGRDQVLNLV